ncbi:hypothetical protein [Roseivirga spongicola]|uniref:Uncharacterized protein n=1 Tax=Roseivirga spongicola TaxID=333140 RepID=A0A150XHR1_9BACT|nr:hypothetical protein [Roseivirga spongicola]KYG78261.1 hypothetical protein AWW68_05705 [Roseivirga spongicola]WPZ12008.1 hypothetical protein T7867_07785 [Roseivirga spongicola]
MNSPKVKARNNSRRRIKNLSTAIAIMLAMVTLFQASAKNNPDSERRISAMEAKELAEIEAYFMDKDEMSLEEAILFEIEEEVIEEVKVFDSQGELVASGTPSTDSSLRSLVNQADYLTSFGNNKYYRLAE